MLQDNDVQMLNALGLTLLEAKVYLALTKAGKATIATISKTSKVARPDVYRTLAKLQEKGFAEKIIVFPTEFKPCPMKQCLLTLIENKRKNLREAQEKVTAILWNLTRARFEKNNSNTLQEDESRFSLLPEQTAVKRKERTLSNVRKSFDVVTTLENSHSIMFIDTEGIAEALQRGVKIRVIIDKPDEEKLLSDITKHLEKYPTFKIRHLPNAPKALMSIYDKKEVRVCTCTHPMLKKCPTLWTNNPCLLSILQDYFEIKWLTAMESNL